jgi:4-hydroxy-3-polyprenylbenzoate decarboxylase
VPGREIIVGVSGGSGAQLARRFVQLAISAAGLRRLHLIVSEPALDVARSEIAREIATPEDWIARLGAPKSQLSRVTLHDNGNVGASIASGSYPASAMIVIPCSGGTLGAIAHGIARDLLQRAADVCLKERRPLVLAFRESPYSLAHVENMRLVTLAGAIVAPPSPAFYIESPSVARLLDASGVRAARMLGLQPPGDQFRWTGSRGKPAGRATPRPSRKR